MANVQVLPAAISELDRVPARERKSLDNAIDKLIEFGNALGYPHRSHIQGTTLRELRPRRGNSPWRAFYQRLGNQLFIVAPVGPEAMHDPRRFRRAVADAQERLAALEIR